MTEFETKYPAISSPFNSPCLRTHMRQNNWEIAKGSMNKDDLNIAFKVATAARIIAPIVCSLPGNEGKTGFVVVLTKKAKDSPVLTFQVGTVKDPDELYVPGGKLEKYCIFASLKAQVLKDHPDFISSSQNLSLPENQKLVSPANQAIPGGALALGDWIVSVSAFKNPGMDTASVLAIGMESGLKNLDEAKSMASDSRIKCSDEFECYLKSCLIA